MSRLAGHSDIDAVRDATDLVRLIGEHIALRPKGREHVGLCPFHDDRTPSMAVVTHKGNAFYKCHACGAGGDVFDFVMQYHKMEFGDALRYLAERANITLTPRKQRSDDGDVGGRGVKKTDVRKANSFASIFFRRTLNDLEAGKAARDVIASRGISDPMVEAFSIGAAPDDWDSLCSRIRKQNLDLSVFAAAGLIKSRQNGEGFYDAFRNRLIFPICDELGNPIAFGARKINPEDEPKYLNSAESQVFSKSKTLYGLHRAKRAIIESKQAIVTEGYTDVIACHQAGICNVVGTLGTALTRDHARALSRLCDTVVLVFDGDEAGQKAADRGLEVFFNEPVDIKICVLPDECDPDELLKEANGKDRFDEAVKQSVDALAYKIERFKAQLAGAGGLSARQKRLEAFLSELAQLGFGAMQGVRKRLVLVQLADLVGVSINDIEAAMPTARRSLATTSLAPEAQSQHAQSSIEFESKMHALSPARRRAERELLAILICEPESAIQWLRSAPSSDVAVDSPFEPELFRDPLARAVANVVVAAIRSSKPFRVHQLLDSFDDDEQRKFILRLHTEGEIRCEAANDVPKVIDEAFDALQDCIRRDEYAQSPVAMASANPLLALQQAVTKRKEIGHMPAAIAKGVRS